MARYIQVWAVGALSLLASTHRLWGAQQRFPQVPLVDISWEVLPWIETCVAVLLGSCIIGLLCASFVQVHLAHWIRAKLMWAVVGLFAGLFLLDQHRLQPWAYQFGIIAALIAGASASWPRKRLAYIAIGIYFYSAISKFDYQFLNSLGPDFLETCAKMIGIRVGPNLTDLFPTLSLLFPTGELLAAALLLFGRTRLLGLGLVLVIHAALLLILGPLGLQHQPGVLLWNVFFLIQAWLLFGPRSKVLDSAATTSNAERIRGITTPSFSNLVFVAALLLPSTAWWGGYDHWLSWELYAPRNSRIQLQVNQVSIEEMPSQIRQYVVGGEVDLVDGLWHEVDLAQWSLDQLNTPIYPQERFQLGVAKAIIDQVEDDRAVRVVCQSRSNRWTGRRAEKILVGRQVIDRELELFWFNARPRGNVNWNP